jgi:hypothetical protein
VAAITLVGLLPIIIVSYALASAQMFIGSDWGDIETFVSHAHNLEDVVTSGDSVLTNTFFGAPTPYAYSQIALLESLPLWGLSELTDPFFAYNFLLLTFLLANFCSMYTVLRLLEMNRATALLASMVYLMAPVTIVHALGHLMLVVTFLLPLQLYLLYRIKLRPRDSRLWLALGLTNGAYLWVREELGLFAVIASLAFIALNWRLFWGRQVLIRIGAWSVIVIALAMPILALYLQRVDFDRDRGIETARTAMDSYAYTSSPANYLFPSDVNFIYDDLPSAFVHTNVVEQLNYLGIFNLAALIYLGRLVILRRDRLQDFAARSPFLKVMGWELTVIAVGAAVISFGPLLRMNESFVKTPLYLIYQFDVPGLESIRAWARFGIFTFAVATLLAAHVFEFLFRQPLQRPLIAAIAVVLGIFLIVADQYPLGDVWRHETPVPKAVDDISAAPGDPFVMHLPLDLETDALHNSNALFFQVFHNKPIVNGYMAFLPPLALQKIMNSPLACLSYPQMTDPNLAGCGAPEVADYFLREDIRYIVYEKKTRYYLPGTFQPDDDRIVRERTTALLHQMVNARALIVFYEDSDFVFYRLTSPSEERGSS